jgi:DNA-binding transcriptional MerR regulator
MEKNAEAFRTISEVAEDLDLPQHVLRFWETRFAQIRPLKRGGNRRYYRPGDVELLRAIRRLLYHDGYTIKGVQRLLKDQGVRAVAHQADEAQEAPAVQAEATPPDRRDDPASIAAPVDRRALKALLAELNECERLIERARRG